MNKININNWKEFKITDLFTIKGVGSISVKDIQNKGDGEYPYITRTKKNNGITGCFDYFTTEGNVLTIETTLSGECFYHNYKFSTGDHIMVLYPKKNTLLNEYTALFIKTIWRKNSYKYGYGRPAIKKSIENTYLILPVDKNNIPDWKYMENYIKNLKSQIKFKPIYTKNNNNLKQIDMSKWGEFSFIDERLWTEIKRGERFVEKDRISGDIEYYSASQKNNSLTDRISNPLFVKTNCIVYNTFAFAFYVEGTFTASDEIQCFHNPKLNKYNALFITTIMNKSRYKYQFGRKAFLNKLSTETIKLPITQEDLPDWQYMENYIKSLPYGDLI